MATFTYTLPTIGGSEDNWGTNLNANWTALGSFLGSLDSAELAVLDGLTATTTELNILDGVTATTAELNILNGVTATTAELNILDGVTATTAEINYIDGVTSGIQAQLDAKAASTTQATAVWEAGTGTTESVVSPAKIKAAIQDNVLTTGSRTAQIGDLKIAWGTVSCPLGGTAAVTLPFTYTSTSSFGAQAISNDGNHPGATRAAQGVTITSTNQIVVAKASFYGGSMHWFTIGY